MTTPTPPFTLNTLTESFDSVTQTLPSGLDAGMTYLLASVTEAVVQAFLLGQSSLTSDQLAALPQVNGAVSYVQIAWFTASEALAVGAVPATTTQATTTPGAYITVPIGVAIQACDSSGDAAFNIIAMRGTQTYQEWVDDATAVPQGFALAFDVGSVHAGMYDVYTSGPDGLAATADNIRPGGSLAEQVLSTVLSWTSSLPLYVTGHSLGAALAMLCAMDVAKNASSCYSALTMINFAPPKLSAGLLDKGSTLPLDLYDPTKFASSFQSAVPNSYSIVNAADLVPIMPPTIGSSTAVQIVFNPVVASGNIVTYAAQLGTIDDNHELGVNYLPYAQALTQIVSQSEAARAKRSA